MRLYAFWKQCTKLRTDFEVSGIFVDQEYSDYLTTSIKCRNSITFCQKIYISFLSEYDLVGSSWFNVGTCDSGQWVLFFVVIAGSGIPVSCRSKLLKSSICSFSFAVLPSAIVPIAPVMFIVEIIRKGNEKNLNSLFWSMKK